MPTAVFLLAFSKILNESDGGSNSISFHVEIQIQLALHWRTFGMQLCTNLPKPRQQ